MPSLFSSKDKVQNVFHACCVLHNWIRTSNNYDTAWDAVILHELGQDNFDTQGALKWDYGGDVDDPESARALGQRQRKIHLRAVSQGAPTGADPTHMHDLSAVASTLGGTASRAWLSPGAAMTPHPEGDCEDALPDFAARRQQLARHYKYRFDSSTLTSLPHLRA